MPLWLIGMMGAGKSEVGRLLARRLQRPFIDTDQEIADRLGCSIGELWGKVGQAVFRDLEAAAVLRAAEQERAVVATGGGVVLQAANVERMRASGMVVWLEAEASTLARRVGDGSGRPLLANAAPEGTLEQILEARTVDYARAAQYRLKTDRYSIEQVADQLEALWNG